jgi:hypothetical protein
MTEKEKIDVIQLYVQSLRKEMNSRIESDLKFGQMIIAGIAAIVVFKGRIQDFLPVAPILALLLVLIWQQSEFSLFRLGKRLAREEEKINELAGEPLMEYESALWAERKCWFSKLKRWRLVLYCLVAAFSFLLIRWLMSASLLANGPTESVTYAVAGGIVVQILNVFRRECNLFKSDERQSVLLPANLDSQGLVF